MVNKPGRPVVIGVDRTPGSQLALRWGVDEAVRRGLDVRLVSVYAPSPATPVTADLDLTVPALEVRDVLDEATAYARDRMTTDRVASVFVSGAPARVLLDESTDAELLVLGSRRRGTIWSVVMGSVSCAVAAHASCPVAVVRTVDLDAVRPILVGIDGSAGSQLALELAFQEADLRGAPLDVAHCWQQIDYIDPGVWYRTPVRDVRSQIREWLANTVAELRPKYPQVTVHELVLEGSPGLELTARAKDAGMVVVGSRGHGGIAGLLLGSVSQNLLHHAACTVLVAR